MDDKVVVNGSKRMEKCSSSFFIFHQENLSLHSKNVKQIVRKQ